MLKIIFMILIRYWDLAETVPTVFLSLRITPQKSVELRGRTRGSEDFQDVQS